MDITIILKQIKFYWFKIPISFRKFISAILIVLALFLLLDLAFPFKINIKYSTIINSSDSSVVHAFLSYDDKWRMKTEINEITPLLEKAIIFKEDKYFYYHPGVNLAAIIRAATNNILKQKRTSGASTITMQVARLLEPKNRTYFNKIIEMFRAFQLEMHFSKEEIFQMYLNIIPFGGNIEGVKAASILYFEKAPNHLSLAELTALSIIPNRPNSLVLGKDNAMIIKSRNLWLKRFEKAKLFPKQDINDALNEPLTASRHISPKSAPQYSFRLRRMFADKPNIYTHLDLKKQIKIENIVKNYINRLYSNNIKNASVLIIDNNTNSIITYIGSADFSNKEDAGQVDGIKAIRSPGSTLKPFLYALAFDKGLITPKLKITDVPVNYSGYEPKNYDSDYHGIVTVSNALINSLNIIAVKILNSYKTENFIKALKKVNFNQIRKDESKLGLSLVLGGCGVTLEELTMLYHAFANQGVFTDVNWLKSDTSNTGFNIISTESAYMLTEILTQVKRPDLPLEWQNSADLPKVAWKTGTSYGRKDAWSIGYNKDYTIGVWVGNFSSEGVQELSGSESASPLLFEIFNTIDYKSKNDFYEQPEKIDFRMVCSESGLIPNSFCKNLIIDAYIPEVSSTNICNHLKKVYISPDSTISYCTSCLPENGYIEAFYPNYKPEMITYYEKQQVKYIKIPKHNPKCERVFAENIPEITSPVNNVEYFVDKTDSTEIMLTCNAANDVNKVFWYVNDKFLKAELPTKSVFYKPQSGKIKISCTDDKGRNSNVYISVKMINF
ncbi:MAG: penicillin-binding protein 1C [Bacteroidales bacterium]|nr:penicillin-binding protein 1C [Bacteroidales bacterium]MBN2758502.1 penicillin-binding protein 1C [Bacteroidales bacterium]